MNRYLFLVTLLFVTGNSPLFSQKIYNVWLFGDSAGLNFNSDPPARVTNSMSKGQSPPYYTSTICDKTGRLLFFTNGLAVWNSTRTEMPKYMRPWPWFVNDTVLPLICPYPENDSLYYLLGVGRGDNPNDKKLISLTIKMAADADTGAIVYPQPSTATNYFTVHTGNASCMLAGTAHCNQKDTWIITVANNALTSFLVSAAGVSTTPVVTPLPIAQSALTEGYSNIRFSANGEKLVIPVIQQNKMLVYDFNNQTGNFSNPRLLGLPGDEFLMDVELSPSGTRLYYGSFIKQTDGPDPTGVELHNIYQLDLEAGSEAAIENGRFRMNAFPDRGGCPLRCYTINRTLNLGPDGKIYVSLRDVDGLPLDTKIHVIELPDNLRENASYRRNYIDLGIKYKFININYIKSGSFSLRENGIQVRKRVCLGLPTEFSLLFTAVDSVKWDFGDPSSGSNNFSTSFSPTHIYSAVGIYTVKAVIYKNCFTDTAISRISIEPDPIVRLPEFIKDTTVCVGGKLFIDAKVAAATGYQWSDGLIYSYRTIDKPGQFLVKAYNLCSSDQKSFTVSFEECPCEIFVPSAFTPNNDGLNDNFKPLTRCFAKDFRFRIFNRYGNMVFSTNELTKGWDGNLQKMPSPAGVYTWLLQYRDPNNNSVQVKRGTVTLIR